MSFREGKGRSPALEKLASEARDSFPAQTQLLPDAEVERRLHLAIGAPGGSLLLMLAAIFIPGFALLGLVLAGSSDSALDRESKVVLWGLGIASVVVLVAFFVEKAAISRKTNELVAKALAWAGSHPFPVTGYRDWLVNDRSTMRVELRAPLDGATFVDAMKAVDPAIETVVVDESVFDVTIPSRVIPGENPTRFGNVPLLAFVFHKVLLPLHSDVGIERVSMGGTVVDR